LQLQDRYDRARGRVRTPRVVAFFDLIIAEFEALKSILTG
jgi:hypothetical protein